MKISGLYGFKDFVIAYTLYFILCLVILAGSIICFVFESTNNGLTPFIMAIVFLGLFVFLMFMIVSSFVSTFRAASPYISNGGEIICGKLVMADLQGYLLAEKPHCLVKTNDGEIEVKILFSFTSNPKLKAGQSVKYYRTAANRYILLK